MKIFKRIFLSISVFLFLVVFGVLNGFLFKDQSREEGLRVLEINSHKFEVEIADTPLAQSRGLAGRDSLGEDRGMLFVFPDMAIRSFWMKGMKFPLDIVWIRGDQVVGISENLPLSVGFEAPLYISPEPIDKVLEINGNLVKKLDIREGDKIVLK